MITELLNAARLNGLVASRRGQLLARVGELDAKGTRYLTRLVEVTDDAVVPLTRGAASVGSAALGEDGRVFFTSARPGEDGESSTDAGLWLLPARGEARRVATRPGGFERVEVAGDRLVVELSRHSRAGDETEHRELTAKRTEARVSAVLHDGFPVRYWDEDLGPGVPTLAVATVPGDLETRAPVRPEPEAEDASTDDPAPPPSLLDLRYLPMPDGRLVDWQLDPGARFVLVTMQVAIPGLLEAFRIWRIDLDGGTRPALLVDADPVVVRSVGAISPDGRRALVEAETVWTAESNLEVHVEVLDLAAGTLERVWPGLDHWVTPIWVDDGTLAATSDDRGRGSVWIGSVDESCPRRLAGGPGQSCSFSDLQVRGDALVAITSAVDVAPAPVAIDRRTGTVEPLPNPADVITRVGSLREVETIAADGTSIRAWLQTPAGEGPHPLLVFVHGGPWNSWNAWSFRWNPAVFVDAGYAVLLPDPAISTGYGQAMIDRGQQELGGTPYTDVLALVDAAVAEPDVDATRTALAGGSYGGYMANWMAGHTGARFRCIVTHASLWNTVSMGRTTDNAEWDVAMRRQSEEYSPHLFAGEIEVPMLVVHGDRDYRVPIGQGQELWYDLLTRSKTAPDEHGRTRHRFLYFPDEGHWILGRGNAQVWYETVLRFVDEHVRGTASERPATLG